jgi:hypothetical protein
VAKAGAEVKSPFDERLRRTGSRPRLRASRGSVMRRTLKVLAALAALSITGPSFAAPTCQDIGGQTMKCGAPGAMPVGWSPSREQLAARPDPKPLDANVLAALGCVLGGLFALIALMPEFDGRTDADWGDPGEED